MKLNPNIQRFLDERRRLALPGDGKETLKYCVDHFLETANHAIADHGYFAVALSGGSTPKAIFQQLALPENRERTDWSRFFVFWSDERSVPPDSSESNYHMAMEAGWKTLPVPANNIFRMVAERDIEQHAKDYERIIQEKIPNRVFDLVMLGMGGDGHTASLFPHTAALNITDKWVAANYIPQKSTWRMTFTYPCINHARLAVIYVLGAGKETMVHTVLNGAYHPETYPSQKIGTPNSPSLWIVDDSAAALLQKA